MEGASPIGPGTSYMLPTQLPGVGMSEGHLILSPDVRHLPPTPPPRTPPAGPGAGTLRCIHSLSPSFSSSLPLLSTRLCVRACGLESVQSCLDGRKLTTPFRPAPSQRRADPTAVDGIVHPRGRAKRGRGQRGRAGLPGRGKAVAGIWDTPGLLRPSEAPGWIASVPGFPAWPVSRCGRLGSSSRFNCLFG